MSIADERFGREREMKMEDGEEGTELVDGYSEQERGGIEQQMVYRVWDRRLG